MSGLPTVSIRVGDALDQLRQMPDESVHCVVTSPPYWGLRDYGIDGQIGLEADFWHFLELLTEVFAEVRRVLHPLGTCWVNMGDSYASDAWGGSLGNVTLKGGRKNLQAAKDARRGPRVPKGLKPKDLIGQPWHLAFRLQADGWWLRRDIVWEKPSPMPESVKDRPTSAHEFIFLLSKRERYWYDAAAIAEPCVAPEANKPEDWERAVNRRRKTTAALRQGEYTSPARAEKKRSPRPGIDCAGGGQGNGLMSFPTDFRNARDVWRFPSQPVPEAHFATFPEALPDRCIRAGCPEGGIVLDPFGGAGTTGLAAAKLGRSAILVELNPEYAAIAERRIRNGIGLLAGVERVA